MVHYSRTSIIRPPLGSGPWIGVRIREMFRIRTMSTCAHYMYLISKVIEKYDLLCPSRTSTRIHIHHTSKLKQYKHYKYDVLVMSCICTYMYTHHVV